MFAEEPRCSPRSLDVRRGADVRLRADVRLGATYKSIPLCIFKHSGLSRPLRQLYQNPYFFVSEVVNLKCYLLNNLGHVVKTTPTYHRFGGSRYTLTAKREL